jgi:3-oxoacyl-(acyl-carrier-protein) synthase
MIQCPEPGIDTGLEDKYLRRMSRLIRLGWTAAKMCLDDAGGLHPDAILTGSGWGSVGDSEKFLLSVYKHKETFLPPTPFIQSTHNALGAQIAMLLESYQYNMSYAHITTAFEHALLDSMLRLQNNESGSILCGGFDEITQNQFTLYDRLGYWRNEPASNLKMIKSPGRGTIAGEGYNFFFLQNKKTEKTYAEVKWAETVAMVNIATDPQISERLQQQKIDWVFAGMNGDKQTDDLYRDIIPQLVHKDVNVAVYKHLCGEYLTSSAFAMALTANIIQTQKMPGVLKLSSHGRDSEIRNILIYNHHKGKYHSFILLSRPV